MAKMFLKRLLEKNPSRRYSADKALNHPWITRRVYDNIPVTHLEMWKINGSRKKLIECFGSLIFFLYYKNTFLKQKSQSKKSNSPPITLSSHKKSSTVEKNINFNYLTPVSVIQEYLIKTENQSILEKMKFIKIREKCLQILLTEEEIESKLIESNSNKNNIIITNNINIDKEISPFIGINYSNILSNSPSSKNQFKSKLSISNSISPVKKTNDKDKIFKKNFKVTIVKDEEEYNVKLKKKKSNSNNFYLYNNNHHDEINLKDKNSNIKRSKEKTYEYSNINYSNKTPNKILNNSPMININNNSNSPVRKRSYLNSDFKINLKETEKIKNNNIESEEFHFHTAKKKDTREFFKSTKTNFRNKSETHLENNNTNIIPQKQNFTFRESNLTNNIDNSKSNSNSLAKKSNSNIHSINPQKDLIVVKKKINHYMEYYNPTHIKINSGSEINLVPLVLPSINSPHNRNTITKFLNNGVYLNSNYKKNRKHLVD